MKTKNITLYIIICLIIIAGIAVWDSKGFNTELQFSSRYQIQLTKNEGIDKSEIENIATEVLGNTRHFVQEVEVFGNSVAIVSEQMSEDQRNEIVNKFNEKYEEDVKSEDVEINYIPFTRVKDVIKHFIIPGAITLVAVLIYFIIRFRKLSKKEIILKTILYPVIAELLIYSIMAIVRIPFGRLAIALSVGLYLAVILILTSIFEEQRSKYIEEQKLNKKNKSETVK